MKSRGTTATFSVNSRDLRIAKVIIVVFAILSCAISGSIAVFGPEQQIRLRNGQGAMLMRVLGWGFFALGLAVCSMLWFLVSREEKNKVTLSEEGIVIHSRGKKQSLSWHSLRRLVSNRTAAAAVAANSAMAFGLLGVFMSQILAGSSLHFLETQKGKRIGLPGFLKKENELIEAIAAHVPHEVK